MWTRTRNDRRVLLHRLNNHQLQYLHRFQVILQFQSLIYHHFHVPIAALVHLLIGIVQFWTNVRSLFHEVHVVTSLPVAYVALLDHTDVDTPLRVIDQDFQVVLLQSLCAQLPHNVVKHYMTEMMITLVMTHTTNQLPSNLPFGNIHITINLRCPTMTTTSPTTDPMTNLQRPSGNHGVNGKTIPRPPTTHTRQAGSTTPSPFPNIQSTPILHPNLHPNPSLHFLLTTPHTVAAIIHVDQAQFNLVAPPPLFLQDIFPSTFKTAREMNGLVTSVMPCTTQRMRAANELGADERPQPSMSIEQANYDAAMEQLHQVDQRIPGDIAKKAVQLFFSTGLLPDYDLSTCHVRELPQTNMLALVMPLPDISRFQMPSPFGGQQSHTWALCHGTTIHTSQLILLEGKIRPANWSFHRNPQRCHLPTFGAFYIGREVSNADQVFPPWAEKDLLDSMEKKGKGQLEITVGAMYRGSREHLALKAGGNEKGQLNVAERGIVTTPEKYTIAHSNHVGLKFIALKWADLKSSKSSTKRPIDIGDTESDEINYRPNEERHSDRRRR